LEGSATKVRVKKMQQMLSKAERIENLSGSESVAELLEGQKGVL
jgi:hypothetical protein